jgi:hypothetical protein
MPGAQGTHVPEPSQTPPAQLVPAGRCPFALQTGAPVEQSSVPVSHEFVGVQLIPAMHATHVPLGSHTPPAQGVPGALSAPATQTGAPVVQLILPT